MERRVAGGALFGGLVCGTFGLGVWQTKRYYWKVGLIEERRRALAVEPRRATVLEAAQRRNFERSIVRGRFKEEQVEVGPRPPPPGLVKPAQGMATGPVGYEVVAPFLDEHGTPCLVNKGWVPKSSRERPQETSQKSELVELVVLPTDGERQTAFSPANTAAQVLWLELPFIASLLFPDAGDTPPPYFVALGDGGGVQGGGPWPRSASQFAHFAVEPPTHAAYAFTWFAISIAGAFMTRRLLFPASKPRRPPPVRRTQQP